MALKPVKGKIQSQELNDNFSYLDSEKASKNDLANVSGGVTGIFDTFVELKAKYPNGKDGLFLVNEDAHLYYWKDDEWKQSIEFTNPLSEFMTEQDEEWVV